MNLKNIIQSQYESALEMLAESIQKCPDDTWNNPADENPTWKIAYHAIFIAHLYLQQSLENFVPWEKHHDPETGVPFTRQEVLEFLIFVKEQVSEKLPDTNMDAQSGFDWLPFTKLELQIYNIRHIQQHVGELFERLGSRDKVVLNWVSLPTKQEN